MENSIMKRTFAAVADFDRFRTGEQVEVTLYPDCLEAKAVSGRADVKVGYSDVKIVCHCKKADLTEFGRERTEPLTDGGEAWGNVLDSAIVSGLAQRTESRYDYTDLDHLLLIGYMSDGKELWIALQDEGTAEAKRFAGEAARLADTEVVKTLRKFRREVED